MSKLLDYKKVIGYRLEYDSYSGYYINEFTVWDAVWYYQQYRKNTKYNRDVLLVSAESARGYWELQKMYGAAQETLRLMARRFKCKD